MSKRETFFVSALIVFATGANLYLWGLTERNTGAMHECSHQQTKTSFEIKKEIERRLKSIESFIINASDLEKLELNTEIEDLKWQNEKLRREFLNLYNLMKGLDIPAFVPKEKVRI